MSKQLVNHLGKGKNLYLFRGDAERIYEMFGSMKRLEKLARHAEQNLWAEYQKAKPYVQEASLV